MLNFKQGQKKGVNPSHKSAQTNMHMEPQYQRLADSQCEIIKESVLVQRKGQHSLQQVIGAILWMLRFGSSGGASGAVFHIGV